MHIPGLRTLFLLALRKLLSVPKIEHTKLIEKPNDLEESEKSSEPIGTEFRREGRSMVYYYRGVSQSDLIYQASKDAERGEHVQVQGPNHDNAA